MSGNRYRAVLPFEVDPSAVRLDQALPVEDRLPSDPSEGVRDIPEEPRRRRSWLGLTFGLGLIGVLVVQAIVYLRDLAETTPLLGVPLVILTAIVLLSAAGIAVREWRDVRRLQKRADLRVEAERMVSSELHGSAEPLLVKVAGEIERGPGLDQALTRYESARSDDMNDGELLRRFEHDVLAPADKRAYRLVLQSSRDIGFLTALSPLGLLDGVLVLWRTLVMLKAISRLYGMAPGPTASLALMRRSVRNAALAGLADVITHAATEHIGASLAAMLSARAGQGAGNALLAAKLGIEAMKVSRPLPFVAEEVPTLRQVRRSLLDAPAESVGRG